MKSFLIDTSTEALIIILMEDDKIIDYHYEIIKRDHSTLLMPSLDNLLTRNQIDIKNIKRIIVASGPGSYTGVRIGVTVAKTLSYTLNIPLYQVSTLELMACSFIEKAKYIMPIIDARRGNVFGALYQVNNNQLIPLYPDQLYSFTELLDNAKKKTQDKVLVVGLGEVNIPDNQFTYLKVSDYFNPQMVFNLNITEVENVHTFVPNYKRKAEAEMNLK